MEKFENENYLSIYQGELTGEAIAKNIVKVKAAFPALAPAFFDLLIERLKEKGFSDQRLADAVSNLIDTCPYPTPTLANILSFDSRIKILTYKELCNLVTKNEASFEEYSICRISGKAHYVRNADKEMFRIPNEI